MTFRIGQKVVCIIAAHRWEAHGYHAPEKGQVYTVRAIGPECIMLFEIRNPREEWRKAGEVSYWAHGFRPVVSDQTDISVFKALLQPNDVREKALAQ